MIGIVKAYTTRVGSGPFPTELHDEQGEFLRKVGGEYGVTTGRARRTGWFDAVIARYATRVNGVTDFFVTKLDVLSNLDKVPVCVAYEVDGKRYDEIPMTQTEFHHAKPVYEYLDGWWEDISEARSRSRTCPRPRRPTSGRWRSMSGAPVARGRRRPAARPDAPAPPAGLTPAGLKPGPMTAAGPGPNRGPTAAAGGTAVGRVGSRTCEYS